MTGSARGRGLPTGDGVDQFRVYIGPRDGSGLYLQARVFATRRKMLAAFRDPELGVQLSRTAQAVMETTQSWRHTARGRRLEPCIGRVNFHRQGLGMGVVAHEFAHAMFAWADRKRLLRARREQGAEEELCHALERMLARFQQRASRLDLI